MPFNLHTNTGSRKHETVPFQTVDVAIEIIKAFRLGSRFGGAILPEREGAVNIVSK